MIWVLIRLRNDNIVWWYITYIYIATHIIRYHTRNRMQTPQIKLSLIRPTVSHAEKAQLLLMYVHNF
jgi:hypothetical protein